MTYLATLTSEGRMLKREERCKEGSERQGKMVDSVLVENPLLPCFVVRPCVDSSLLWTPGTLLSLILRGLGTHTS